MAVDLCTITFVVCILSSDAAADSDTFGNVVLQL